MTQHDTSATVSMIADMSDVPLTAVHMQATEVLHWSDNSIGFGEVR